MSNDIIVKQSSINGRGIFAARDFKKGEVVLPWQIVVLTKEQVDNLPESEKHYVDRYQDDGYLLHQEPERYINHSCDPNTGVQGHSDVAIRDIAKGEEITTDYSVAGGIQIHFLCQCKSSNCKTKI